MLIISPLTIVERTMMHVIYLIKEKTFFKIGLTPSKMSPRKDDEINLVYVTSLSTRRSVARHFFFADTSALKCSFSLFKKNQQGDKRYLLNKNHVCPSEYVSNYPSVFQSMVVCLPKDRTVFVACSNPPPTRGRPNNLPPPTSALTIGTISSKILGDKIKK